MDVVRLTKEFRFEMAHALYNYDGKCRNIHGHSYKLIVTVKGEIKEDIGNSRDGMVMDFSDLKSIVNENIIKEYDHTLVLNEKEREIYKMSKARIIYLNFQPTCENMVCYFAKILKDKLPNDVELYSLKLYETETSCVEWYNDKMGI